jgi:hypothetical protein
MGNGRGALAGAVIAAIFGVAWSLWAATGLPDLAAVFVGVAGIVIGLLIFVLALRLRRATPSDDVHKGSLFSSRAYLIIVGLMVVGFVAGSVVLSLLGLPQYRVAWIAAMVGGHFVAFARVFWTGFYRLGFALLLAAVVGTVAGIVTGDDLVIIAATGILAACSLFVAGALTLLRSRTSVAR